MKLKPKYTGKRKRQKSALDKEKELHINQRKKEYLDRLDEELTLEEGALLNLVIYHNPKHIEYYKQYHAGRFNWCYDYIMENRGLLSLAALPEEDQALGAHIVELNNMVYGIRG